MNSQPIIRWAGSKRKLLPLLRPHFPTTFGRYIEPFLGSGSVFFELKPTHALLNDRCTELVDTYTAVRDNVDAVIRYLKPLKVDKDLYYEIRENRALGRFKRAAEFLYLNKTCWNGLYRVNLSGKFNVPFGAPKSLTFYDGDQLRAASDLFLSSDAEFLSDDFEVICDRALPGDFVFLDPPYVTKHNLNGFSEWNERIFSWEDQLRLAATVRKMTDRGIKVMMTNANHESIRELYPDMRLEVIERMSTLASNKRYRGKVDELIIKNYE